MKKNKKENEDPGFDLMVLILSSLSRPDVSRGEERENVVGWWTKFGRDELQDLISNTSNL